MSLSVPDVLTAAGLLIRRPECWCRSTLARNRKGQPCDPTRRVAVAWDACGAVMAAGRCKLTDKDSARFRAVAAALAELHLAAGRLHRLTLEAVNDRLEHADVLEVFRSAIRSARVSEGTEHDRRDR